MNPIINLLTNFSFAPQEAEVYVAALSLGTARLTQLAKKVGKNRTAVYFHARNLVQKGILKETKKGKILYFTPIAPVELADQFDRHTTDFKSQLPQLEALGRIETDIPLIEVTESHAGFYKVYDEIASLPVGGMFRILEGRHALEGELKLLTPDEWHMFFKRMVERKIETKGLFTKEGLNLPQKILSTQNIELLHRRIWHLRMTPEERLPFQDMLMIYGNKCSFLFPDSSLVVTIKHRGISAALTIIFDALYLTAEPGKLPGSQ